MIIHNPILTGSFTFNGTDVSSVTGSSNYSASFASGISSLNSATSSLNSFSASVNTFTASAATTGSNTFVGNQVVSGSLTVTGSITTPGTLTAQTLVVQTITSSVDFVTGSTRFGTLLSNTHVFSGSITMNPGGLFVSSSGIVGIGVVSPDVNSKLDVNGQAFVARLALYDNNGTPTLGTSPLFYSPASATLAISTGTAERMRITSAGRVGIGETSPVSALVVATPSDTGSIGQSGIVIEGSSTLTTGSVMALAFTAIPGTTRARAAVGSVVGSDWGKGNLVFYTRDASDSTALTTADEKMRITSGGNVGIGTTNPGYALEVSGNSKIGSSSSNGDTIIQSNSTPLQIRGRGAYDRPFVHLSWDVSPDSGVLMADTLRFNTGATLGTNTGTERIRITNSGSVGIGITNPTRKLDIISTSEQLRLAYDTAGTTYSDFRCDSAGGLLINTSANYIINYIGGSERMRITSSGVKFQNGASSLNYYEEGTFTPTSVGTNFNVATPTWGRYVRIGNQVTVNCRWAVQPSGTGRFYIVFNLPFAFYNDSTISYTGAVSNYNSGFNSGASSNVGTSVRNSSGSTTQQYVEAVFTTNTNTDIHFSMTYYTF